MNKRKIFMTIVLVLVLVMTGQIGVFAVGEANGDSNNQQTVKQNVKPTAPQKISALALSNGANKVNWAAVNDATGYKVYRSKTADGKYNLLVTTTDTSYVDENVFVGRGYYYKVRSIKSTDSGILRSNLSKYAMVKKTRLKKVTIKSVSNIRYNQNKITWTKSEKASGYFVYRKKAGKNFVSIAKISDRNKLTYVDKSFICNQKYSYKVKAYYKNGSTLIKSSASNIVSKESKYKGRQVLKNKIYYFDNNYKLKRTVDGSKKMICLTYDDGPSVNTDTILNVLEKNNAAATFFVVGNRVSSYPNQVKRADKLGCEIANHTYTHATLTRLSASGIRSEISKTDDAVKKLIGKKPSAVRPPGGAYNDTVKRYVDKPMYYWSIDTLDWKTQSTNSTINSVLGNAKDGSIVLMHDLYAPTANAAKTIVPELKKRGYQLVTIRDMVALRGGAKAGHVYFSF